MVLVDYIKHLYLKWTKKRIDYDFYLMSKHWKKTRRKALKRADYKCQICATRKYTLEIHHNNYKCLYWEKNSDLIVVCRRCHKVIHKYIYKPKEDREVS